jgi:hypothetical protein
MNRNLTLLAALRTRAERSHQIVLPAEEVRTVGAAIGFADAELIAILEALSKQGVLRLQWGGEVRLLGSEGGTSGQSSENARPSASPVFHGPVIVSTGEGAQIDARGSGHGAAYKPGEGGPEAAFGALAAAVVELQTRLSELEGDEIAKVQALESAAREVAERGAQAEPDKAPLSQRLQALTARLEDVAKLQSAVTKLEPTLTMIKSAAGTLKTWLLGS